MEEGKRIFTQMLCKDVCSCHVVRHVSEEHAGRQWPFRGGRLLLHWSEESSKPELPLTQLYLGPGPRLEHTGVPPALTGSRSPVLGGGQGEVPKKTPRGNSYHSLWDSSYTYYKFKRKTVKWFSSTIKKVCHFHRKTWWQWKLERMIMCFEKSM